MLLHAGGVLIAVGFLLSLGIGFGQQLGRIFLFCATAFLLIGLIVLASNVKADSLADYARYGAVAVVLIVASFMLNNLLKGSGRQ